jgi:predicted ATPase
MRRCPATSVIVTSREALRSEGEHVYRVPPLDVPGEYPDQPDFVRQSSAVQLLIARATELDPDFSSHGDRISTIAAICRRLDGIPLAIEFAAARVTTMGVQQVASRLDDRFGILTMGRRTALPRHQTLLATLEWSHTLLTGAEQATLRRLGVFAGHFSLEAAAEVLSDAALAPDEVAHCVASLVEKSLVVVERETTDARYRLLETIRAYALRMLETANERDVFRRRHAEYHLDQLKLAAARRATDSEWARSRHSRLLIADVSAALEWVFSPRGDSTLGVALTLEAIPLWIAMSLLRECRRRVEQAIARLNQESDAGGRSELQLTIALATAMQNGAGPGQENTSLWRRATELAERLGDPDWQLRALWGLWIDYRNGGDHRAGLEVATRFHALASTAGGPEDMLVADRMVGMSRFVLGDLDDARRRIEGMLAHYVETSRTSHMVRFHFEQRAGAEFLLAIILAVQGFPQRARAMIDNGVAEVAANGHTLQLCVLLAQFACPVAWVIGDLGRLDSYISNLLDSAERHGLVAWSARGRCWEALLRIRRGEILPGIAALDAALRGFPGQGRAFQYVWILGELAKAKADAGRLVEAREAIETALERAEIGGEQWCVAELLRLRGEIMRSLALPVDAEASFTQALSLARHQGALCWELRAARSLARLWCASGRRREAAALLAPLRDRFDAVLETDDLRDAWLAVAESE